MCISCLIKQFSESEMFIYSSYHPTVTQNSHVRIVFASEECFLQARLRQGSSNYSSEKNSLMIYLKSSKGVVFWRSFLPTNFEGKEVGMDPNFKEASLFCVTNVLHTTSPPDLPPQRAPVHHLLPSTFFKMSWARATVSFPLNHLASPSLSQEPRSSTQTYFFLPLFYKITNPVSHAHNSTLHRHDPLRLQLYKNTEA